MMKRQVPIMKPYFDDEEAKAAAEALASGWVAQGPRVAEFEKAVAVHEGIAFGIATTNCTTALHLLMVGMGFGPGQDVIVPSFTFVATGNAVEYTGANAILADVDPVTFNINVSLLDESTLVYKEEMADKINTADWLHPREIFTLRMIVPRAELQINELLNAIYLPADM